MAPLASTELSDFTGAAADWPVNGIPNNLLIMNGETSIQAVYSY